MVNSCSALNCSCRDTAENKAQGITFHRFPKDTNRRIAWAQACKRANPNGTLWMPSGSAVLCSRHFIEKDFEVLQCSRRLRANVVPSIFDFNSRVPPKRAKRHRYIKKHTSEVDASATVTPVNTSTDNDCSSESGAKRHSYIKKHNSEVDASATVTPVNTSTDDNCSSQSGAKGHRYNKKRSEVDVSATVTPVNISNDDDCSSESRKVDLLKRKLKDTEAKYQSVIKKLKTERRKVQQQEKTLSTLLEQLHTKKLLVDEEKNLMHQCVKDPKWEFIETHHGQYSENLKQFTCTLLINSAKSYEFARKYLNLPHARTIRQWMENDEES